MSQWVWGAMDPESKLLLAIDVGNRTLAMTQRVVHHGAQVLAPDCTPLFLTDGCREYLTALLTHYGPWVQPPRHQATGPAPQPRWRPLPQLLYAQVVKTVRRRHLVRVTHRVVFGTSETVQQVLTSLSGQINTAFVERLNLTIRQHVAAVGRAGHHVGGGAHGSGLNVTRGALVSRAAVAPAPGAVKAVWKPEDREGERARCANGRGKWPEGGLGNPM